MKSDHVLIKASAGSGKTFQLSNRYLQLLLDGASPDTILATTFTRKAAGEIMDRVLRRLADAVLDDKAYQELSQYVSRPDNTPFPREMIARTLSKLAQNIHRVRISTLDSFFQQIAGAFNLELGLPPNWSIMESTEERNLVNEAVRTLLEQGEKAKILQLMYLLFKGESLVAIVHEITSITKDLIGIYDDSIESAWENIPRQRELTADEIRPLARRLAAAEIALNNDLSPNQPMLQARNKDLEAMSVEDTSRIDWLQLIASGIGSNMAKGSNKFGKKTLPDSLQQVYQEIVDQVRAVVLNDLANRTISRGNLLQMMSGLIRDLKHQHRRFFFSDITARLADSEIKQEDERIAHRTDFQTRHLLLDEFQDTAPAQWRILKPFAERIVAPSEKNRSFFCVGDVKQAIYGWRGGVAAIFDTIEDDLGTLDKLHLERSYRSAPHIMNAVNAVFQNIRSNAALDDLDAVVQVWQKRFQQHSTDKMHYPGYCTLETSRFGDPHVTVEEEDDSENDSKGNPSAADNHQAHIEYVVERIIAIHKRTPGASIGVLTRTNEMIDKIITRLRQQGIPASEEGGNTLVVSPAVQLILSALTLADHPGDRVALFHLANSPLSQCLGLDLPAVIALEQQDKAEAVSWRIRHRLLYEGYFNVLQDWAGKIAPHCDSRDFRKLIQLLELASEYQSQQSIRTRPFLELVRSRKIEDPSAAKIRVISIHRSKGLEYDIVILPELDGALKGSNSIVVTHRKGVTEKISTVFVYPDAVRQKVLPPHLQEMVLAQSDEKVEESLCLLYVAMTRAIHELVMILTPQHRTKDGKLNYPKTMAGVLHAALAQDAYRDEKLTLWAQDNPKWYLDPETPSHIMQDTTTDEENSHTEELTVALGSKSHSNRKNFTRITPSEREGEDDLVDVVENIAVDKILFSTGSRLAMSRGTAIHACFEKVVWLDQTPPDREKMLAVVSPFLAKPDERERVVGVFFGICAKPEIREQLSHDRAMLRMPEGDCVRAFNERRFLIRLDAGTLQQGIIDRLVVSMKNSKPVVAEILDFKTDRVADDEQAIAERTNFYRPQLKAYQHAVAKMYQLDTSRIACRILFTSIGRVVDV